MLSILCYVLPDFKHYWKFYKGVSSRSRCFTNHDACPAIDSIHLMTQYAHTFWGNMAPIFKNINNFYYFFIDLLSAQMMASFSLKCDWQIFFRSRRVSTSISLFSYACSIGVFFNPLLVKIFYFFIFIFLNWHRFFNADIIPEIKSYNTR